MCMPRIFGSKLIDGQIDENKSKKIKCNNEKPKKKQINQSSVEFDYEDTNKRD
jgi:hypothetical protein